MFVGIYVGDKQIANCAAHCYYYSCSHHYE